MNDNLRSTPAPTGRLGLPLPAILALALLGLPRVVLHDLHLIDPSGPLTWLLALGPVAVWIAVALARRVPAPFLTVLAIGVTFGVLLVITHQVLWVTAYGGQVPSVGEGPLATVVPRIAAVFSGLFTGALIGAVGGLVAWAVAALTGHRRPARTA